MEFRAPDTSLEDMIRQARVEGIEAEMHATIPAAAASWVNEQESGSNPSGSILNAVGPILTVLVAMSIFIAIITFVVMNWQAIAGILVLLFLLAAFA